MKTFLIITIVVTAYLFLWAFVAYYKYKKNQCTDGPAFWCESRMNWDTCNTSSSQTYDKYCCGDNRTWMARNGYTDPDPDTNGFNDNC